MMSTWLGVLLVVHTVAVFHRRSLVDIPEFFVAIRVLEIFERVMATNEMNRSSLVLLEHDPVDGRSGFLELDGEKVGRTQKDQKVWVG